MLWTGREISRPREFSNRRARHDRKSLRSGRSARPSRTRSRGHSWRMKIRAVLFDLDETLIEEESSNDASALAACEIASARHGVDCARLFTAMRQSSAKLWRAGAMFDYCREIGISSREGLWGSFTGDDPTLSRLRDW